MSETTQLIPGLIPESTVVAIARFSANVMVPTLGFKSRILIHLSPPRR